MTILLILVLMLSGCGRIRIEEHTKNIFALNTYITLTAYGGKDVPAILDRAGERIEEIENLMSTKIDTSDVALINKNAGIEPVTVSEETFFVIERALWYSEITNGAFDITIYPIVKLWDITGDNPRLPSHQEIGQLLPLVDYKNVILDKEAMTVFLLEKDMGIDLGGIAKGYAADEVGRILREAKVEHALINLGGDIVAVGDKVDNNPWHIGVRNPRGTASEYIAVAKVSNEAIVSSGDYERFLEDEFEKTGERYHHIFDPKTGYPARSGIIATTVLTEHSIDADALATCLFILGKDRGLEIIEKVDGARGLCIDETKGIYSSFSMDNTLEIIDEEYKIRE